MFFPTFFSLNALLFQLWEKIQERVQKILGHNTSKFVFLNVGLK